MRASSVAGICVALLLGCGGQEGPTGPDLDDAELTATVAGTPFISTVASVTRVNGTISVSATAADPVRSLTFTVPDQGEASYGIGAGSTASALVVEGTKSWVANGAIGGGTVAITLISAHRITGSVSLSLGATGSTTPATITVGQGVFDIAY